MNAIVEMRQVLAELELLSHGGTTAWDAAGGGKAGSREPQGESRPPHLVWRDRFKHADLSDLPRLVGLARQDLAEWRTRVAPIPDVSVSLVDLILEKEGWSAADVARRFGVSAAYVCRIRMNHDRDAETGAVAVKAAKLAPLERRRRVRDLKEQGLTVRQIATLLDVSHPTVVEDLKAA